MNFGAFSIRLMTAADAPLAMVLKAPYVLCLYDTTATSTVYTNGLRLATVFPPSTNFITYD